MATVSPNQTIQEAVALMHQHNVGAIPSLTEGIKRNADRP